MRPRVPQAVVTEFDRALDVDTARAARAIAQTLNQTQNQETITMKTKRNATTKKAELAPATPKPAAKAKVTKATKKAAAKKAKPTERAKVHAAYTSGKLKVQKRIKINTTLTYHGRNETLDGKSVKVTGYEGRGGVFVEFKGERYVVSPHALIKEADVEKKS